MSFVIPPAELARVRISEKAASPPEQSRAVDRAPRSCAAPVCQVLHAVLHSGRAQGRAEDCQHGGLQGHELSATSGQPTDNKTHTHTHIIVACAGGGRGGIPLRARVPRGGVTSPAAVPAPRCRLTRRRGRTPQPYSRSGEGGVGARAASSCQFVPRANWFGSEIKWESLVHRVLGARCAASDRPPQPSCPRPRPSSRHEGAHTLPCTQAAAGRVGTPYSTCIMHEG